METVTEDLEQRLQQAEAALEESLAERNRLWEQLQRNNAAADDVKHLRALVASMESSVSWRLTTPIRVIKTTLGPRWRLIRRLWPTVAGRLKRGA